jgi:hypothetical protein
VEDKPLIEDVEKICRAPTVPGIMFEGMRFA